MFLYLFIFILVAIFYFSTLKNEKYSPVILAIIMMGLGVFVGLGDMLGGYDRYIYGQLFDIVADDLRNDRNVFVSPVFLMYYSEPGYGILNIIIGFFTRNRYIFIFIFTVILYLLLLISFLKYTNRSPFVVLLLMGLWFCFTFTYLRQAMSVAIAWLAIQYAIERKPWKFFLIIALAYSFHNGAIILAPIYFLPSQKISWTTVVLILIVSFMLGFTPLSEMMFGSFTEATETEDRLRALSGIQEEGYRFEYLLEAFVFTGLIFAKYDTIDDNNKGQVFMLNLALCFCITLLFFIRSSNGGRLSWYFMIGLFATLNHQSTVKRKSTFTSIALVIMMLFLYIRIINLWGILINPYKSFLSNGHRQGDVYYEKLEYDRKYDEDKFYKW